MLPTKFRSTLTMITGIRIPGREERGGRFCRPHSAAGWRRFRIERDMAETFDPYHRWLGISPKDQPPNHYRLLGIDRFEGDPEVIRDAAEQRIGHVRRYQLGKHQATSQRILNELAAAKACLLNPEKKTAYDTQLREKTAAERSEDRPQAMAEGIAELETHARPVATGPLAPPEETPSLEWLVQGVRGSEQAPRARTAAKPGTARAAKKRGLARAFESHGRSRAAHDAATDCRRSMRRRGRHLVAPAYSLLTGKKPSRKRRDNREARRRFDTRGQPSGRRSQVAFPRLPGSDPSRCDPVDSR